MQAVELREHRPGRTSLLHTGRGLMTVQTEVLGDPAKLSTIVDFRGRVLKRWTADPTEPISDDVVRRWHEGIEEQIRRSLDEAVKRRAETTATTAHSGTAAWLFCAAMESYSARDFDTCQQVLEACTLLLPNDRRAAAALARVSSKANTKGKPCL